MMSDFSPVKLRRLMPSDLCPRDASGACRLKALRYWKCTTEPASCAFKDADHAARVLAMCQAKLAAADRGANNSSTKET